MTAPALESDLVDLCKTAAERMGAFLAVVGQRNARKSGSTLGFPDLCLICAGQIRLIEMKRTKGEDHDAGRLNVGQMAFVDRAAEHGVIVHVVDNLADFCALVNECRRARGVRRRQEQATARAAS